MIEYIKEDIEEVMEITGLAKDKAEKLFNDVAKDIDDGTDDELCSFDVIDVIKLEYKAKKNGADKMYATSEKPKTERKPRERKVDNEKLVLLNWIERGLYECGGIHSTKENEVKLHFSYNGNEYSVTLTKHRPKKSK